MLFDDELFEMSLMFFVVYLFVNDNVFLILFLGFNVFVDFWDIMVFVIDCFKLFWLNWNIFCFCRWGE